jgi:chromate transport protein ChrA
VTETQLIKIVATALFVGVPALLAAALQRLLAGVEDGTLRRALWSLLSVAGVALLVLLALNPGRSGSADLKIFGNILAGAIIASFFAALIVGRIINGRRG